MPSRLEFTPEDFEPAWKAVPRAPARPAGDRDRGRLQRHLLLHPRRRGPRWPVAALDGFYVAEAVWVTHSAGVARAVAEILTTGRSDDRPRRVRAVPLRRGPALPQPTSARPRSRTSWRSTTSCTRCSRRESPRNLRVSPFHARQRELGAFFLEGGAWERPYWYEANAALLEGPAAEWQPVERDAWSARYYSPIAAAEAWKTRTAVAMYDMTPLRRLEVSGPGAVDLLQRLTTGDVSKKPGAVTYTLLLDETAASAATSPWPGSTTRRSRSASTAPSTSSTSTREARRQTPATTRPVGPGARHHRRHLLHRPLGPAGPRRGQLGQRRRLQQQGPALLPRQEGQHRRRPGHGDAAVLRWRAGLGDLHHRRQRPAAVGRPLAGRPAVRRGRRRPQRLQRAAAGEGLPFLGHRHDHRARPVRGRRRLRREGGQGGLSSASRRSRVDPRRQPAAGCAASPIDDGRSVVLGKEPVFHDGQAVGYVTSAAFGYTIGKPIAYAYLPSAVAEGEAVEIEYFGDGWPPPSPPSRCTTRR